MLARFLVLAALLAVPATASAAQPHWLCNGLKAKSPCRSSLTSTVVNQAGDKLAVHNTKLPAKPPIDCFFVYPTISEENKPQADFKPTKQIVADAHFQVSRFSQVCRIWAPLYRQVTLYGLFHPDEVTQKMKDQALGDVRAAWAYYLKHYNKGRGVVFVSHSQGTFVLRKLIAADVDKKPAVRKRLVGAILGGGNVLVRKDGKPGGDFQHVPQCSRRGEIGCFLAWSTFNETPPDNAVFGIALPADAAKGLEVACTNPAAIGGGTANLNSYIPSTPFPDPYGQIVHAETGDLPKVSTPWIETHGFYSGECRQAGKAHVLMTAPLGGATVLKPQPDATWGLHLADLNLAMVDLVADVKAATKTWLRKRS